MERLIRTTNLNVGETIVLIQNGKHYFYDIISLINHTNLNLKCKNHIYENISLSRDGYFTTLKEYESK